MTIVLALLNYELAARRAEQTNDVCIHTVH
jgi:hypothetical protein